MMIAQPQLPNSAVHLLEQPEQRLRRARSACRSRRRARARAGRLELRLQLRADEQRLVELAPSAPGATVFIGPAAASRYSLPVARSACSDRRRPSAARSRRRSDAAGRRSSRCCTSTASLRSSSSSMFELAVLRAVADRGAVERVVLDVVVNSERLVGGSLRRICAYGAACPRRVPSDSRRRTRDRCGTGRGGR